MKRLLASLPPIWREAVEELWRRRLRTGLTLLGLVFGVGAIVAMQAVGEGSRREALRLVESLGLHNLIAQARTQDEAARRETRERGPGLCPHRPRPGTTLASCRHHRQRVRAS